MQESELSDFCPASWQDNGTLHPGDDQLVVAAFSDEARVTVRPPAAVPEQNVTVDPREIKFEHPVYQFLNQTWLQLNDSRPEPAKEIVSFESRPKTTLNGDPHDWGVFVVVHPPPFDTIVDYWVHVGVCWDSCFIDYQDYAHQNETTFRPFPNGIVLRDVQDYDSDRRFHTHVYTNTENIACMTKEATPQLCEQSPGLDPQRAMLYGAYTNATPNVVKAAQVNRTTVKVEEYEDNRTTSRSDEGPAGSSADPLHASVGGRELPFRARPGNLSLLPPVPAGLVLPEEDAWAVQRGPSATASLQQSRVGWGSPSNALVPFVVAATVALGLLAGGWFLYHRIRRDHVLEQQTRKRIHELIQREPGIRIGTIASRLGLNYNSARHHVERLEEYGFVRHEGDGQKRYFASGNPLREVRTAQALAHPAARAVYDALRARRKGMDQSALGNELGLPPFTVSRAVARLVEAGLVATQRVGRRVVVVRARE